jgi:hypothetical protein
MEHMKNGMKYEARNSRMPLRIEKLQGLLGRKITATEKAEWIIAGTIGRKAECIPTGYFQVGNGNDSGYGKCG